ncbi:hypothetical protein N9Y42_10875, partial [Mariniblastus sp.]|nr:hypothetical protein [Mariniblastus sp.]
GLCEIVGQPRFDQMYESEHLPVQDTGPFRLLVTTARTPAFNDKQHRQVVQGLTELKNRFTRNNCVGERHVELTWRLSEALLNELNLPVPDQTHKLPSLGETIEMSDAVITTPSTIFLESLIKRRPVALLDFTNSPAYVPAAWRITATAHINPVLEELASPPAAKMFFQRAVLRDQVELGQDSKLRLFTLFREMIDAGQQALKSDDPLSLPVRILSDPQRGIAKVEDHFDLSSLFPNSPVFRNNDVARLQQELVHAIARLEQLPKELYDRDEKIQKKSEHIASMAATLDGSEARIENANRSIRKMMKTFESQREQNAKKSEHVVRLTGLLEEAHAQLKTTRNKFQKRADAMLAAAAKLHEEVQQTQLESQQAQDESEPEVPEQNALGQDEDESQQYESQQYESEQEDLQQDASERDVLEQDGPEQKIVEQESPEQEQP